MSTKKALFCNTAHTGGFHDPTHCLPSRGFFSTGFPTEPPGRSLSTLLTYDKQARFGTSTLYIDVLRHDNRSLWRRSAATVRILYTRRIHRSHSALDLRENRCRVQFSGLWDIQRSADGQELPTGRTFLVLDLGDAPVPQNLSCLELRAQEHLMRDKRADA